MDISLKKDIQSRFREGAVCPHCGSRSVVKYGFFKGKQRYRCKDCSRTFNIYTKTLLSWSHYKDKWGSFIETMKKDMSLRQAEKEINVDYVTLFYWRHKIMNILNEANDTVLHGTIEMMSAKLPYLDKSYHKKDDPEEMEENEENLCRDIYFTFLYQRDNRLKSYIYKDSRGVRNFIEDISYDIDNKSIICLNSSIPFRYSLLYKKFKVADNGSKRYKRRFYFNADNVRKYLAQFKKWMTPFRGVSSKNLIKYSAFFKTHILFDNMEYIILDALKSSFDLKNQAAIMGEYGF
ncbi:MAG: transposase [Bacillota bacterium]|nr:transposase [Bacillota bacterium]